MTTEIIYKYKVYSPSFDLQVIGDNKDMLWLGMNIKESIIEKTMNMLTGQGKQVKGLMTGDIYQSVTSFLVEDLTEQEITCLKMFGLSVYKQGFDVYEGESGVYT